MGVPLSDPANRAAGAGDMFLSVSGARLGKISGEAHDEKHKNEVEVLAWSPGPRLTIALPQTSSATARRSVKLNDVEKEHIKAVLDTTRWRIRGNGGAAELLGLKATTLETRMAKLGLQRPRH